MQAMKKVTLNKLDELCYRVYVTKKFQNKLSQLRPKYGIPEKGFGDSKTYERWYRGNEPDKNRAFSERCALIAEKYDLPPDGKFRLKEYILFGTSGIRPESLDVWMPLEEMGTCHIELTDEKREQKTGGPFVKIVIPDHVSQRDAVAYIRSHWKIIQELLDVRRGGGKKHLVRSVRNREIQEKVLELGRYSTKELEGMAKEAGLTGKSEYKEQIIGKIISARYGITMSAASIKKTIARGNKLKKGH